LAYGNSLANPFVFDDVPQIKENQSLRQLWPLGTFLHESRRPVAMYSLAVNYYFGGLDPRGYHLVNIGLHVLAGLVLFGLVRRTLLGPKMGDRYGASATPIAFAAALLWLVHPLATQAVDCTIQRMEVLMALFYLLTLYALARSTQGPGQSWWAGLTIVACALGMLSKEVMVTAPCVALLYDRTFLAGSWRAALRRRWGLYLALTSTWAIYPLLGLQELSGPSSASLGVDLWHVTRTQYLLNQPLVILHYLRLAVWPAPLIVDYGWRPVSAVLPLVSAAIALLALTSLIVWALWRGWAVGFLGAAFLLILAPTSSVIPLPDLCVEHRMYLPLAAVVVLVVCAGHRLGRTWVSRWHAGPADRPMAHLAPAGIVAILAVILAGTTYGRNRAYQSELSLWQDTVAKSPDNPRAHCNLGLPLAQAGREAEALRQNELAVALRPDYPEAQYDLAVLLERQGRGAEALQHYAKAVGLKRDTAGPENSLGLTLAQQGRYEEAITHYAQALRLQPGLAEAQYNWGLALAALGRVPQAITHYEQAARLDPKMAQAQHAWALALAGMGQFEQALPHYAKAQQLEPQQADVQYNWAVALGALAQRPEAIAHYQQALRLRPDYLAAHNNLAWLLATGGRAQDGDAGAAVAHALRACALTQNRNPVCLSTLSAAYASAGRFSPAIDTAEQALAAARQTGQTGIIPLLEAQLVLYRAGKPYCEPVRTAP
jgi:tetratricopeptide (TPR) repeat protein